VIKTVIIWIIRVISIIGLLIVILNNGDVRASPKSGNTKTIHCDSSKNIVRISTKRLTALSFLENPKELVPGDGSFDFKRVQNDVFIKALSPRSRTNVFIFVGQKRCRFELVASESGVDDLLEVREPSENVMEVKFYDK